jgi:hypothetical protein
VPAGFKGEYEGEILVVVTLQELYEEQACLMAKPARGPRESVMAYLLKRMAREAKK